MKLYYRTIGTGKPLIIMHGLFGSSDNWLTIAKTFAQHYQVFLLDARNHGQSPWSDQHNYSLMAQDLEEFITEHQLQNPFIIGHSMGGKTLMKFATTSKTPIAKIVIVDISPRYYEPHHTREIGALKAVNLATLQSRQEADDTMALTIPELMVRQFLMKGLYRTDDGTFHWRFNVEVIAREIENIGEAENSSTPVNTPTLFIKGAMSNYYITEKDEPLIAAIFPNSTIVTIPNAGHWVQAEQPRLFYEAVMNFFGR